MSGVISLPVAYAEDIDKMDRNRRNKEPRTGR